MAKSPDAFRTISEVADWLGVPTHVLRFWESRFSQVKPVKRAGGRRYYRPTDMELLGGIRKLLHDDGLTIRGVQKLLREEGVKHVAALAPLDGRAPEAVETSASDDDGGDGATPGIEAAAERAADRDRIERPAETPAPAPTRAEGPGSHSTGSAAASTGDDSAPRTDLPAAAGTAPVVPPAEVPAEDPEDDPPDGVALPPRPADRLRALDPARAATARAGIGSALERLRALRARLGDAAPRPGA